MEKRQSRKYAEIHGTQHRQLQTDILVNIGKPVMPAPRGYENKANKEISRNSRNTAIFEDF